MGRATRSTAGRDLSVDNFNGQSLVYNQVSVNYTREITGRLRLGARFKYLMGIASGESTEATGSIRVSSDAKFPDAWVLTLE